jgi:FkbM family methyltransferase
MTNEVESDDLQVKTLSQIARNASTALRDPEILQKWMQYQLAVFMRREPVLRIGSSGFSGFPHFNAYLGAWKYRPDDAETRFLRRNLHGAKAIVDVGANFGALTALMCELAPGARVYAFEPHPKTFAALDRNVRSNGLAERVFCGQTAVGKAIGTAHFLDTGEPATNRLAAKGGNTFEVALTTIDSFCRQHELPFVDFMKIDVEGAEAEVLLGAGAMFAKRLIGSGMIEICPGNLKLFGRRVSDLRAFFETHGYDLCWFGTDGRATAAVQTELPDDLCRNAAFMPKRPLPDEARLRQRNA